MSNDNTATVVPRSDFPVLSRTVDGRPLLYLDSAATSLKPQPVLDAIDEYNTRFSGNVFRGNHLIAEEASDAFDAARGAIAGHIGADPLEVTFWLNTTDAINSVAYGMRLTKADRVIVPICEHHSNFVPWLHHATVDVVPVDEQGRVDPDDIRRRLAEPARLVALGHVSNVTGAIQPIAEIAAICNEREVPLLVDGAQGCPHFPIDVGEIGCAAYAFSGHKMLGPTGVGALWTAPEFMETLAPTRFGGGMVDRVLSDWFSVKDAPHCFEAGTPNVAGAIGLGAAVDYLQSLGHDACADHERLLCERLVERALANPHLRLLGPRSPEGRVSLVTLVVDKPGQSADHVSFKLSDRYAIMTRSGTHCAQPYYQSIGAPTGLRISAYVYTSVADIDATFDAIDEILA